jgi:hypothetical protein
VRDAWRVCVVAALAIVSCQRSDSAAGDRLGAVDSVTVNRPTTSTSGAHAGSPCGVDARTRLTGDALGDLRIGGSIDELRRRCRVVRDTVVRGAEGMPERRMIVDLGRDSVVAVIDSNRVWRVQVQSSTFRTADSLGVGSQLRGLRRTGARLLTGEGAYFVTLPSHCGLSFRLRGVEFGRLRTLAQVPDSATVGEVLVVGCRGDPRPNE